MQDAHAPLLQRRGHREHVPQATVPRHRRARQLLAVHQAKEQSTRLSAKYPLKSVRGGEQLKNECMYSIVYVSVCAV